MPTSSRLVIFHPSPYMVKKLDDLMASMAPTVKYENVVVPELLDRAKESGVSDSIRSKIQSTIEGMDVGAGTVILCSCSTLGGCAEEMASRTKGRVIRIDRPMAEMAVNCGTKIGVAAALESTLKPTQDLLMDVALQLDRPIQIREIRCDSAWQYWQRGDEESYIREIVRVLKSSSHDLDVIVLAQGSMAPAEQCSTELGIPVLSSPRTAINRVLEMLHDAP